jgi:diguanylate cyclase (GGDEF)-like protein
MSKRRSSLRYAVAGLLLSVGAPIGLWIVRAASRLQMPGPGFIRAEVAGDPILYAYLFVATAVVFAALGVEIGRVHDRLRESALTDPLTGLYNRRHFTDRLAIELRRASRSRAPLSVLLLDVDGLKAINDQTGHDGGDCALREVAQAIRRTCRMTDVDARIGGDEFAVLAPDTSCTHAAQLAERIRLALSERTSATVSVGVADLDCAREPRAEALFTAADAALYQAKEQGRNQVRTATPASVASVSPIRPRRTFARG